MAVSSQHSKQCKKAPIRSEKQIILNNVSSDESKIAWMFDRIDRNGDFKFSLDRKEFDASFIMGKMIEYSSMKWSEIKKSTHDSRGKSKHHYLDLASLSDKAFKRIVALSLEAESDSLFSFALNNKTRLIGLREGALFHVIWFDPNHEFCPSHLK